MPLLSLSEVAQRTGMARSSIYRLIDEGRLSATLDHRGRKCVELTEVLRVFGAIQNETGQEDKTQDASNKTIKSPRNQNETDQDTITVLLKELAEARAELQSRSKDFQKDLDFKDRELSVMQTRMNEAIAEKHKFWEHIERQSLLLAAPKPARPSAPAAKKVAAPPAAKRTSTSSTAAAKSKPVAVKKIPAVKPKAAPAVAVKPKTTPPVAKPKAAAKTAVKPKAKPAAAKAPRRS